MELTRKQIEDFRKENTMYPPAALEDWGIEENLILNTLCDYYLAQMDTGMEKGLGAGTGPRTDGDLLAGGYGTEPRPSSVE